MDAVTLRAGLLPDSLLLDQWQSLPEQMTTWIRRVWRNPQLAGAVWLASPHLASRLDAVCEGVPIDGDGLRRLALALARYAVRAERRATPFGAFAGVAAVRFGPHLSVDNAAEGIWRIRPDAAWLAAVIGRLETDVDLVMSLTVQTNNLAFARAAHLVVPWQPHLKHSDAGPVAEVVVRRTEAVVLALRLATSPVLAGDLADKIKAEFSAPQGSAEHLVCELVAHGALVTALRAPSTSTDPLAHLLDHLPTLLASSPDSALLVPDLRLVHRRLGDLERAGSLPGDEDARAVATSMRALAPADQPLMVAGRLGSRVVLPEQVAAEAAVAADVLHRLSPYPGGRPEWLAYCEAFVHRYGEGTAVPLARLLDPVTGLGYPSHYTLPDDAPRTMTDRDERLFQLVQRALVDGAREVRLDDEAVAALADGPPAPPGAHVDLCAEVRATSAHALDAGLFTLAVVGMGRSAMATSGRFLPVLDAADAERAKAAFAGLPVSVDGALAVQVSFPSKAIRTDNVTRTPQILPALIGVAEHRDGGGVIALDDLAVLADRGRLLLVSLSRRRVLEPTISHAAAPHTMPPLVRFLLDLPRATAGGVRPFDWGLARHLPFRPALRYGRVLLCAARWRVSPEHLPGPDATEKEWSAVWRLLVRRLRLPETVQIGTGDQRLRLYLNRAVDRAVLRAHLDAAAGPVTVVEAAGSGLFGWLDGRISEIVFPLATTAPPGPAPAALAPGTSWPPPGPAGAKMPGSGVLSARLVCDPGVMALLVTRALPVLLTAWDEPPPVWWLRMRHPAPHLRIRLHTRDYGRAAERIGRWVATLREQGLAGDLTLDTYHPETGRYGGGEVMARAEELFVADSAAAAAQLALVAGNPALPSRALTAVSMVALACDLLGGQAAGREWLIGHRAFTGTAPVDREALRQAVRLDAPDTWSGLRGGPALADAWQRRHLAATGYAASVRDDTAVTLDSVVASLLHLHYVRAEGPDPAGEASTFRLARSIVLATARRRERKVSAR
ncbi:lantibiotic dehydratase [Longispora sp. NPDC051575]|uniref:lantibiotic dehydratase n=1 Tax=Longispora sp. NPDC051575 TaxID=3154943 RepID=UPI00342B014A